MQSGHCCLGNQNCWQEVFFHIFWQGVAVKAGSLVLLQSDWHHIVGSIRPLLDSFSNRSLLFIVCTQLVYGISVLWRFAFSEAVCP